MCVNRLTANYFFTRFQLSHFLTQLVKDKSMTPFRELERPRDMRLVLTPNHL